MTRGPFPCIKSHAKIPLVFYVILFSSGLFVVTILYGAVIDKIPIWVSLTVTVMIIVGVPVVVFYRGWEPDTISIEEEGFTLTFQSQGRPAQEYVSWNHIRWAVVQPADPRNKGGSVAIHFSTPASILGARDFMVSPEVFTLMSSHVDSRVVTQR